MIEIRNLQFQPLTFQLSTKDSLHLGPRECKIIAPKDVSEEIRTAAKRGLLRITDLNADNAKAQDEPANPEKVVSKASKSSKTKRRK